MSRSRSQTHESRAGSRAGSLPGRTASQAARPLVTRLEEAETNLVAKQEANALLNSQVDLLTKQLKELQAGKATYEKHFKDLSALLAKERRQKAADTTEERQNGEHVTDPQVASPDELNAATAERDEASWVCEERWEELRKLGQAGGWLVDHQHVKLGKVLGEGTFGTTYMGRWRGGDVAVKCVRIQQRDEAESFLREVHVLACVRHPNVMPFYGACLQPPQHCMLLCEYLPGGNLRDWLYGQGRSPPKRPLAERLQMALGVARGMAALEENDPPIVHRDLKPTNVFIDAGGHARVADMGLARWLTPESMGVLTGETGTYLYMSPEMIRHELYNSRTDVYSWGVLLVELITQKIPYEDQHLTPLQVVFRTGSQPQHCNAVDHMSHPSSSLITQAS
ncbi:TPA: hypothetical protein ACH3X2_008784 [Trebouxia sp. C0005]